MSIRLKYHFEPQKGWINDPNGLIYWGGEYHVFFQHNPHAPIWGRMHWGHAVSSDLIHWKELPIALWPNTAYENDGGCFSGSAVAKDGVLYLFYTSVSRELGQTQSLAISRDGLHFIKHDKNPLIRQPPADGSSEFRDPKVTRVGDLYYMVCGSGKEGIGKVLLYSSVNLLDWKYIGVLLEGEKYGSTIECPDFFPFDNKYIVMFSQMGKSSHSTMFVYGDFDGKKFYPISFHTPEAGPHFYAPQTFLDAKGRRIIIGWMYSGKNSIDAGLDTAGALSIPRELKMVNSRLCTFPVEEARNLLTSEDELVRITSDSVALLTESTISKNQYRGKVECVHILRDTKTVEVFINNGQVSFSYLTDT